MSQNTHVFNTLELNFQRSEVHIIRCIKPIQYVEVTNRSIFIRISIERNMNYY
jgi:hypothetical protein